MPARAAVKAAWAAAPAARAAWPGPAAVKAAWAAALAARAAWPGLAAKAGMAGAGGAGGVGGMGGAGGAGGMPGEPGLRGSVRLAERLSAGDDPLFATVEGAATFTRYARVPNPPVPLGVADACTLSSLADPGDAGDGVRIAVGDVTIEGGAIDVSLAYDDLGEGYSVNADAVFDLWAPGQMLAISAPGSVDMGAFAANVGAPDDVSGVAPTAAAGFERAGSVVTWDPGNGDEVRVVLRNPDGPEVITCVSEDDGQIVVPADAFAWLADEADTLVFELRRVKIARVESAEPVGDVEVELQRIHVDRRVPLR
ncbi:MAG: hypothetical protein H6706_14140 [Myxococcales bacterium]|nr:hypothetical protein [Myxococcales bacterium]